MKKLFSVLFVFLIMASLLVTTVAAAPEAMLTPTLELGQLKVCKVAGSGVTQGTMFSFRVNGATTYNVPAGPSDRGYCVLAGQYPVGNHVTIEEVIPSGYYVSRIEVKPDRTVSKDTSQGVVTVRIISGVEEVIFTNKVAGSPTPTRTPTSIYTSTPRPTKTPPGCAPNCTPTPTPVPTGRMQICKEADGPGVSGIFTFRFEGKRSRQAPVGACTGLTSVNAGQLTITEVQQAGYAVSEIYTIPADRLISKDLSGGSATVQIVEGTAASQTIIIFRNRAITTTTFTPTPTATPTTTTPSICPPAVIYADMTSVPVGQSVEGMGKVAPYLDIRAKGEARRVAQAVQPTVYLAPNGSGLINSALSADGGFSDPPTQSQRGAHLYTFAFAPGVTVSNFNLHMLDYGDWNPTLSTSHFVSMTAYNAAGAVVSTEELSYTTPAINLPRESDIYGDLWINGDASTAPLGQPGNWIWNVSGSGIVRVVLEFGVGYDPNVAFDLLSFTTECASCQSVYSTDLTTVPFGQSVEGLGKVAPFLDIKAKRLAVRVGQSVQPMIYLAPNGTGLINGALAADGGFSDDQTQDLQEAHLYTFTFTPGMTITNFSLHMLDYGDLNQPSETSHYVSMTAYDANGNVVSKEELSYTTPAINIPRESDLYGDLWINGDAATARLGQPGNWIWNVSGNGIVRVVLEFGAGYDPNVAFDLLTFHIVCQ